MTERLFFSVVNMSLAGAIVIAAVLLLRLLLRRAPKAVTSLLWAAVLLRLLCPVSLPAPASVLSLAPVTVTEYRAELLPIPESAPTAAPSPAVSAAPAAAPAESFPFEAIWLIGAALLLLWGAFSFLRLRRTLIGAVPCGNSVYLADHLETAFVLPRRIYLPSTLSEAEQELVLRHERCHQRRLDPLWKLLFYFALCLHWFNPLVWLAFLRFSQDLELACDEAVLKTLHPEDRADYSELLLRLSVGSSHLLSAPLAFAEGDPKQRIRRILNWQKPKLPVLFAVLALTAAAVALLVLNPFSNVPQSLGGSDYAVTKLRYGSMDEYQYSIDPDLGLWQSADGESWQYLGALTPEPVTDKAIKSLCAADAKWHGGRRLSPVADSAILRLDGDRFYLAAQLKNGTTLLGYGWEDVSERGDSDDSCLYFLAEVTSRYSSIGEDGSLFSRMLQRKLETNVNVFYTFYSERTPGYLLIGYFADGAEPNSSLGYAVLSRAEFRGQATYRLTSLRNYEDARLLYPGVYEAPDAAICSADGKPDYDVIFLTDGSIRGAEEWIDGTLRSTHAYLNCPELLVLAAAEPGQRELRPIYDFPDSIPEQLTVLSGGRQATAWLDGRHEGIEYLEFSLEEGFVPFKLTRAGHCRYSFQIFKEATGEELLFTVPDPVNAALPGQTMLSDAAPGSRYLVELSVYFDTEDGEVSGLYRFGLIAP